jgi:hypothetical protein
VATATLLVAGSLSSCPPAFAATTPVALGTAATFSVLAGTSVVNTGATVVSGDVGVSPSASVTGFPPGTVSGTIHAGDPQSAQALSDFQVAYADAAVRTPATSFAGDLNGLTFDAGVYDTVSALALTGTLTLDAQGNPNAVFIFQVNAALNTAAASNVNLVNGALASNVFWQVAGAAGTGASSSFTGTILAAGAITIGAGATLNGRALSAGTVTLGADTVTVPPTPGVLTISVPASTGNLGTVANTMGGEVISGPLGQVQVTDNRNAAAGAGWVVSVVATPFTSSAGASVPASDISYSVGVITSTGTATYTADDPSNLASAAAAVTATAITGDNSALWDPTIAVRVPGGLAPGTYSGTITHSVL